MKKEILNLQSVKKGFSLVQPQLSKPLLLILFLLVAFVACMKAGDGIGLNSNGNAMVVATVDSCTANPNTPGCPVYCAANPTSAKCTKVVDICVATPDAKGCPGYCAANPTVAECVVKPDCKVTPTAVGCSTVVVPPTKSSFAASVLPIIKNKCQLCHSLGGQGFTQGNLDMSDAEAYKSLVGVLVNMQIGGFVGKKRVVPGVADSSMMFIKISKDPPIFPGVTQAYGSRMPLYETALPKSEIEVIKTWILDGALP